MNKLLKWPVVLLCVCTAAAALAQNNLAQKYRAGMIPMFVEYAQIGSMSDDSAEWMTPGQEQMAARLEQDLQAILKNAPDFRLHVSADKYIYVNIASNLKNRQAPVLGISAHYDTTPDINGNGIKPQVIQKYDGQPIELKNGHVIDPATDPHLKNVVGQTVVTSDGTTNLGADDKAGVVIVMTLIKTLAQNPKLPHGPIQIVITPNEDVGRSAERLELAYYNPDYAFDFDASVGGEIIVENFSAEKIIVTAQGVNGHQSYAATNGYRNASAPIAYIVDKMALVDNLPNHSTGDEGYIEPHHFSYNAKENTTSVDFRLRYFDKEEGSAWHTRLFTAVAEAMLKYDVQITVDSTLQYDNVANGVKPEAKALIDAAVRKAGIIPDYKKERAGTTSAMIMALQGFGGYTVFTGQVNPHNFTEWLSEYDMFKAYEVALNLVNEVAQRKAE